MIALTQRQAEYGRPVGVYIAGAISPGRALRRRAQMTKWADTLAAVEKQFGVDPAIIVAIWGMETGYGAAPGDKDIIRSLVTLAASGYREEFCRDELLHALTILQEGHIAREQDDRLLGRRDGAAAIHPLELRALGGGFFRRRQARHLDQCAGRARLDRELFPQERLDAGHAVGLRGVAAARISISSKSRGSFAEWAALGFRRADGGAFPANGSAYLLFPSGARGPAFLVTDNFVAIKRYNNSDAYALAIAHLADRLRGGPPLAGSMARRRPCSSTRDERIRLQRALAARGYTVEQFRRADRFRAARRHPREQAKAGLRSDGHPDAALLEWLAKPVR